MDEPIPVGIDSLEQCAEFLDRLSKFANESLEKFENQSLADYLESAGAWLTDTQQSRESAGEIIDGNPTWMLVARLLWAATAYE